MNSNCKIAIIGDVIIDEYYIGVSERLSPEFPTPIVKNINTDLRCGGAANVANCLSEVSDSIDLYFTTHNDKKSKFIYNFLKKKNVNIFGNKDYKNLPTLKKRIYVDKNLITRLDYDNKITESKSSEVENLLIKNIKEYKSIIVSDYGKGQISNQISKIIKISNKLMIDVIIDPYGSDWSRYKYSTCLTPNKKELQNIVGAIDNQKDLINKSYSILKYLKIKSMLVTLGSDGMFFIDSKKKYFFLDSYQRQVFDVTGAGDTVTSFYTYFLTHQFGPRDSASFANKFASISVDKFGVSPISKYDYFKYFPIKNEEKLLDRDRLISLMKFYRIIKTEVVFTNGCFDILHSGHLDYLKKSKNLGDILIVGVNSDSSIKKIKGKDRPINPISSRIEFLSTLSFIDFLCVFDEDTPLNLIKIVRPNIIVKGNGYKAKNVIGYEFVKSYGGNVKIIESKYNTSTSKILNLLR